MQRPGHVLLTSLSFRVQRVSCSTRRCTVAKSFATVWVRSFSFEEVSQVRGEFWAETDGLFNGVWELGGMRRRERDMTGPPSPAADNIRAAAVPVAVCGSRT